MAAYAEVLAIAREAIASKMDRDDAPQAARLIREGKWDDTPAILDAILGIQMYIFHASPKTEHRKKQRSRQFLIADEHR